MRTVKDKFKIGKANKHTMLDRHGQAALEFTLIIPILILVILAVSQLGYTIYVKNVLEQAAREGVRIISTTNSNQKANEQVSKVCSMLDKNRLNVKITPGGRASRKVGDIVTMDLTFRCGGLANLIRMLTSKDILIHVESSMRMECY